MQPTLFAPRPTRILVRWMMPKDMPDVCAIDSASYTFAWSKYLFNATARDAKVVGLIAEVNGITVGYFLFRVTQCNVRVLRLAVAPTYRRRGVARELLHFRALSPKRQILFDVREDHLVAHLFLRGCGFRCVNQFKGIDQVEPVTWYRFVREAMPAAERETTGGESNL